MTELTIMGVKTPFAFASNHDYLDYLRDELNKEKTSMETREKGPEGLMLDEFPRLAKTDRIRFLTKLIDQYENKLPPNPHSLDLGEPGHGQAFKHTTEKE